MRGGRVALGLGAALALSCAASTPTLQSDRDRVLPEDAVSKICVDTRPFQRGVRPRPVVASGLMHTCVLRADGAVFCVGENRYRELGDGTWDARDVPVRVSGLDAVDLAADEYATCAVRRNGRVACWGERFGPAPRDADGVEGAVAVSVSMGVACAVLRTGEVTCWGTVFSLGGLGPYRAPLPVPGVRDAVDVTLGDAGLCILHACGRVSCADRVWESGIGRGVVETPKPIQRLEQVVDLAETSYLHMAYALTCALEADGKIECIRRGEEYPSPPPVKEVAERSNFVALGGGQGLVAITNTGDVLAWNPSLVIRQSATEPQQADRVEVPGAVAAASTGSGRCAVTNDGRFSCWGRDLGGRQEQVSHATPLSKDKGLSKLFVSRTHTCALTQDRRVLCWGPRQLVTQAGDASRAGSTWDRGVAVPGMRDVKSVALGDGFGCVATQPGEVFCWGRDDAGQLGDGAHPEDRQLPTPIVSLTDAVDLAAGPRAACALRKGGRATCWGEVPFGAPTSATLPVDLPIEGSVDALAVGLGFVCARRGARVECFSGVGRRTLDVPPGVTTLAATDDRLCALFNGSVACFDAKTGVPDPVQPLVAPATAFGAGGSEICATMGERGVSCWGAPRINQPWTNAPELSSIATSTHHACGLAKDGVAWCWGDGGFGNLGEAVSDVRVPPTELPLR